MLLELVLALHELPHHPITLSHIDCPPRLIMKMRFGGHDVSSQVFYKSRLSFAIVNVKPLLPGHVLVCPDREVARFNQLSTEEVADLFMATRAVAKSLERFYGADSLNIAIQDGPLAGQSVPHVHVHIVPRRVHDLKNSNEIYELLNRNDIEEAQKMMRKHSSFGESTAEARTPEQVRKEADRLRLYMATVADPNI